MKVQIIVDETILEQEIVIRCSKIDAQIEQIQKLAQLADCSLIFYQDEKEFYFPVKDILFFETQGAFVYGHTKDQMYRVKYRLYELEKILPPSFLRGSKSMILNVDHIFSIDHSLLSSHSIQFYNSHKQVYVSRYYFQELKQKLERRRKV